MASINDPISYVKYGCIASHYNPYMSTRRMRVHRRPRHMRNIKGRKRKKLTCEAIFVYRPPRRPWGFAVQAERVASPRRTYASRPSTNGADRPRSPYSVTRVYNNLCSDTRLNNNKTLFTRYTLVLAFRSDFNYL